LCGQDVRVVSAETEIGLFVKKYWYRPSFFNDVGLGAKYLR
jgi:hypothetical protein